MERRKKTIILVPHLNNCGGIENYFNALQLDAHGKFRYFFINRSKRQSAIATAFRLFSNYCRFFYLLVKDGYELVHINPSIEYKSFYRESFFIIISKVLNRKTLIFFRGWRNDFENQIRQSALKTFLFQISYAKASKYIVLSELFKNKLIELGVPEKAKFFIETTVADSKYLDELSLEQKFQTYHKKIVFLFLSKIEKTKGIYIAIDAYKYFLENYPDRETCFMIAGDGSELPAVKQYVKEQNIPNIHFLGQVANDMKKKVLLESHVMLFPSYTEGLPNTILEGMLYGMPIISRVTGGIPDVIQQGVNGYLSESFEFSVYTDFMSKLAFDAGLYKIMAEKNHIQALKNYTTERVKERMLEIYQSFQ